MDASSSRPQHPEIARVDSAGDIPREHVDREKLSVDTRVVQSSQMSAVQRGSRYKEKFQSLREKYEHVMSTHERYEKDLAVANRKLKDLQNECNLLLDAVDIAVPGQPTLQHYLNYDPVPPYMASAPSTYGAAPAPPPLIVPSPQPPHELSPLQTPQPLPTLSRSNSHNSVSQTNGVNGH
ncbi:hypothetical protein EIP86_006120 [Pleurotus ostreatoroseus]|nr:hypothetical protein EIP86_006120 [Pleurotus ostreatoroseus]